MGATMGTQQAHPLEARPLGRRTLLAAVAFGAIGRHARAQGPAQEESWPSLAAQIFDGRLVRDGSAVVAIDAPYRAEDAALVPVAIRSLLPTDDARRIQGITLVIDENPSPLAAVFSPGAAS